MRWKMIKLITIIIKAVYNRNQYITFRLHFTSWAVIDGVVSLRKSLNVQQTNMTIRVMGLASIVSGDRILLVQGVLPSRQHEQRLLIFHAQFSFSHTAKPNMEFHSFRHTAKEIASQSGRRLEEVSSIFTQSIGTIWSNNHFLLSCSSILGFFFQ